MGKSRALKLLILFAILLVPLSISAGKVFDIWTGWQAGELTPYLDGQVNLNEYKFGAKTMQNMFPHVQGPVSKRPGFQYIASAKNANKKVRLVPFEFSTEQAYMLEFGESYIRVYKDQGQIQGIPATWETLLHFNQEDASTAQLDSAVTPHTWTAYGNAQHDTANKKFGTASLMLDGSGDYIDTPDHADFNFTDLGWAFDAWVMPEAGATMPYMIFGQASTATDYVKLYLSTWTSLLLHGEYGTSVFDSSVYSHSINTLAVTSSTQKKLGDKSIYFSTCCMMIPDHTSFDLSGGVWTIEGWFYRTENTAGGYPIFFHKTDNNNFMKLSLTAFGSPLFVINAGGSLVVYMFDINVQTPINTWTHISVVENGDNYYLFIDGVLKLSTVDTDRPANYTDYLKIGNEDGYSAYAWKGYMDDFRILKGKAAHTTGFTVPTTPYKAAHPEFAVSTGAGVSSIIGDEETIDFSDVGNFNHVMIGGDGTKHYLFADGQLQNSGGTTLTYNPVDYTGNFFIGAYSGPTNYFKGFIDEARVISTVSTTASFTPATFAYGDDPNDPALSPYEIVTTYLEAELDDLQYTQSGDTLFIVHPSHMPASLTRSSHTTWTLANVPFVNPPDWVGTTYPSSIIFYENRLWTAYNQTVWGSQTGDYYNMLPLGNAVAETVAEASWTNYLTAGYLTATVTSNTKGWLTGHKIQMTTTTTLPTGLSLTTDYYVIRVDATHIRFATSAVNAYAGTAIAWTDDGTGNHTITPQDSCTGDACAVQYSLLSSKVNKIHWMSSDKVMTIGTAGAEYKVSASSLDDAITPTNIKAVKQSAYGSAAQMVINAKDSVLYLQRESRKLRELSYSLERDTYVSPDLTQLAEHVTESGIVDMAYQMEPYSILWAVRADGVLAGMTYARDNDTVAWHRHTTDGYFENVATIPGATGDELWVVTRRTINGATVRYIEVMQPFFDHNIDVDDAFFVDAGTTYDGVATTTITGATWLEGETVSILADGVAQTPKVVTSGSFTIPTAASKITYGLPYTSVLQTMRYSGNGDMGTLQGQPKRINKAIFRLENAVAFEYGHTTASMAEKTFTSPYDGDFELVLPLPTGTDREGYITVRSSEPYPFTIISIVSEVNW